MAYREVSWDDDTGHSVIWEYDDEDRLVRRGVITHWAPERWDGDVTGEVVWHDARGEEVKRAAVRGSEAGPPSP